MGNGKTRMIVVQHRRRLAQKDFFTKYMYIIIYGLTKSFLVFSGDFFPLRNVIDTFLKQFRLIAVGFTFTAHCQLMMNNVQVDTFL